MPRRKRVSRSYLIFGVQRSGSTLVCEALKASGFAGSPEEWFYNAWLGGYQMFGTEPPPMVDLESAEGVRRSLQDILEWGSTPNGVFGAKIMWNYWPEMLSVVRRIATPAPDDEVGLLRSCLPDLRFLRISRRNRVAQAVSWARAEQGGRFSSVQAGARHVGLEYDVEQIRRHFIHINHAEAGWERFFGERQLGELHICYEDLIDDYAGVMGRVLRHLGIEAPDGHRFSKPLERQADALNSDWERRFRQDQGE